MTLFYDMMYKEIDLYMNKMISMSKDKVYHIQILRKIFKRLKKCKLNLNPIKCTFSVRTRKLLGFIISSKGIDVDLDKIN